MCSHEFRAAIRGFHVYLEIWEPYVEEELRCDFEEGNAFDMFSIKVMSNTGDGVIIGHLPREISRPTKFFLDRGAIVSATVRSINIRRSPLFQGGLEIPCFVSVTFSKTVKGQELMDRYKLLVTRLYIEPETEIFVRKVGAEVMDFQPKPAKKKKVQKTLKKEGKKVAVVNILSYFKKK